ncbi:MAG: hypothetical protein U1F43_04605 [Myxococcota bacterium]
MLAAALFAACDTAGDGAAVDADAVGSDATPRADTAADAAADTVAPSTAGEQVLTKGNGDDLFPSLDGDDLVWARLIVDRSSLAPDATAPDCLQCPWCGGCNWQVVHKRLPSGNERVLHLGVGLGAAPRVRDGHVAFVDGNNQATLIDLGSGDEQPLNDTIYSGRAPLMRDGRVWWYGWDSRRGAQAILAWDVATNTRALSLQVSLSEWWWGSQSQLAGIGRAMPFDVDGERAVFAAWSTTASIEAVSLATGEITTLVVDPARDHIRALLVAGTLVTLSYDHALGCGEASCALAFTAFGVDGPTALAPDAEPSIYLTPVVDATRLVWLDKRDPSYALWGLDLADLGDGSDGAAAEAVRLTSAEAHLGAFSPPTLSAERLVWADRRSGRWHLVMRTWR